jgi:hypothetical protein
MTTHTEPITLKQFIGRESITIESQMVDRNPNMDSSDRMDHYKCKLSRRFGNVQRAMTVYFSMGLALCREPTVEDVLDCLASDASTVDNAKSFEDWCSELGYDTDSRKAERTYRACERQREKLMQFLGQAAYDQLVWNTERL